LGSAGIPAIQTTPKTPIAPLQAEPGLEKNIPPPDKHAPENGSPGLNSDTNGLQTMFCGRRSRQLWQTSQRSSMARLPTGSCGPSPEDCCGRPPEDCCGRSPDRATPHRPQVSRVPSWRSDLEYWKPARWTALELPANQFPFGKIDHQPCRPAAKWRLDSAGETDWSFNHSVKKKLHQFTGFENRCR
jgi:hypothetical protein